MIKTPFLGGWYADALTTGERAVLLPGGLVHTQLGDLTPPPGWYPLYVRVTRVPAFRLCGQAWEAAGTTTYSEADGWVLDPRIAHGDSGCIFDLEGTLHLIQPAANQTSQGYRYCHDDGTPAGRLVLGDETLLAHGVSAFTDLSAAQDRSFLIGQWHDGNGVVVFVDGHLRMVHVGACYAIRAHLAGEQVTLAFYDVEVDGLTAWIIDTTVSELRALPPMDTPAPPLVRPKITVLSFDPLFKSGEKWTSQLRVNDLTITVRKDATDNLYFDAENAAGSDHTGLVRHLTIVGQKEPEPPMKSTRFWCQPNIGSTDLLDLFDDMTRFDGVEVFVLYSQHLTQDQPNAQWGQNTYPNFVARDAFRKLEAAGIPLAMEGGFSEGDLVAIDRVAAEGGQLHYVSVSEPLTYAKQHGQSVDAIADTVASYTKQAKDRGAKHVGGLEAWPEIPFVAIESYFAKLNDRGALPDYLHLDIDWNRAAHEHQDPAKFIAQCKHLAFFYGIPLGVFINSTIDPIASDVAHHDNLIALAKRVAAIDPDLAQVHVASWALRTKNGPQDVPQNLGPVGMLQTCAEIKPLFHQLPEAPDPDPGSQEKDMLAKFKDPLTGLPVVAKMLPKAGTPYVTLVRPDGRVWSCQPDGTLDTRSAGSDGTYEQCRVDGGIATFLPIRADESNPALKPFIGKYYSFGFTFFEGL